MAKTCAPELPFSLGAMYWQNPNYGEADIARDMERIRENQFSIIRAFIWWEQLESVEGAFDFTMHDILFDVAARHGIKIMETLGLYLPLWLRKQLAEKGVEEKARYYCLDRPEVQAPMARYIQAVVERYKDTPALQLWNVWNEPNKPPCHCRHTRAKFLAWLKERYRTIGALRDAWLGEYQVFETLCPDSMDALTLEWLDEAFHFGTRGRITPLEYDWRQFAAVNLTENVQWLVRKVKSHDPHHPTHANPQCPIDNGLVNGIDHYQQAQVLDSISLSVHPSHTFGPEPDVNAYSVCHSFAADKIRSAAHSVGKEAWIGELQAGTTYCHARTYTPNGKEIANSLWQAFGRGLKGAIFWEWQSWRSSMMEVGEFSLRRCADGGPTERSDAAATFGRIIKEHAELFAGVSRPESKIAILISGSTATLKVLQQEARGDLDEINQEHHYALYGCYKALNRSNLAVDFISEEQVVVGDLSRYAVLYLPHVEVMEAAVADKIEEFVRNGGYLWADGRCAFLDEHVYLRHAIPGHGLDAVFGCREADFIALRDELEIRFGDGNVCKAYRHAQHLEPTTGEVLAVTPGGHPLIVANKYGKGGAVLVGTYLSLGLQKNAHETTMDYLASFALNAGVGAKVEMNPKIGFEVCLLTGKEHDVLILTNNTCQKEDARLIASPDWRSISSPMDGSSVAKLRNGVVSRQFNPMETVVLFCHKGGDLPAEQ